MMLHGIVTVFDEWMDIIRSVPTTHTQFINPLRLIFVAKLIKHSDMFRIPLHFLHHFRPHLYAVLYTHYRTNLMEYNINLPANFKPEKWKRCKQMRKTERANASQIVYAALAR